MSRVQGVKSVPSAAAAAAPLVEQAMPRSVLLLYRHILSAHRKLPTQHRELGDAYVSAEFRRHRGAAPEFLVPFERQWRDYLREVISSAGTQELGRSLTSHELENLSEEQKLQVLKIAEETVKAAPDST